MAELKRTFTGGKMDKDTDERIVQNGLYREALNISVATSEDSDVGAAQNILGNTKVTSAIQYRTLPANVAYQYIEEGTSVYDGDNYHVGEIIDPQTNMLYRFVHTASTQEGIFMDRIIEFDTSKKITDFWNQKESAVFVDIFKVIVELDTYTKLCGGASTGRATSVSSAITIVGSKNLYQLRWGMKVLANPSGSNTDMATVILVDYSNQEIQLDKELIYNQGDTMIFHGDRNLNFGSWSSETKLRSITGINIVDGMIFWTDNNSEPKKINIERSKAGSKSSEWNILGRGTQEIDDFNQHTLLVVEDENPKDKIINEFICESAVGCTNPLSINYDPSATFDYKNNNIYETNYVQFPGWDEWCEDMEGGCTHPNAFNYDSSANTDDGSCCYVSGCTDDGWCALNQLAADAYNTACTANPALCLGLSSPWHVCGFSSFTNTVPACNFNPNACYDDGSCTFGGCNNGCTSQTASNYDPLANTDDGSCLYWVYEDCECEELPSIKRVNYPTKAACETANPTSTGCCADSPIFGCTDSTAVNYDSTADCPCDGSKMGCDNTIAVVVLGVIVSGGFCESPGNNECCVYVVSGCTNTNATNYNPLAQIDDGSCGSILGCMDANACNYDCATIGSSGSIVHCTDGVTVDDGTCDLTSCYGCMDSTVNINTSQFNAQNYNPNATIDDGSCTYLETWDCIQSYWGCVEEFNGSGEFTSEAACEFNCQVPSFDCNKSDGSCYDPGDGTGAYPTLSLCEANCSAPIVATWECDLFGSNAGSCFDPGDGNGQYTTQLACENDCNPIPETWDCDNQGGCSVNPNGNGQFTSEAACNNHCRVPVSFDCINGVCHDPGTGSGAFPTYGACIVSGCVPAPPTAWDCDGSSKVCSEVVGGTYTSYSACLNQSTCGTPYAFWCDGTPGPCSTGSEIDCANAGFSYTECNQHLTQADCDSASNSCNVVSYNCDAVSGCIDPLDGTGDYSIANSYTDPEQDCLDDCTVSDLNNYVCQIINDPPLAPTIGCVEDNDAVSAYTPANAFAANHTDANGNGSALQFCKSQNYPPTAASASMAGCRDVEFTCQSSSGNCAASTMAYGVVGSTTTASNTIVGGVSGDDSNGPDRNVYVVWDSKFPLRQQLHGCVELSRYGCF